MLYHYRLTPESQAAWDAVKDTHAVFDGRVCGKCGSLLDWRKTDFVMLGDDGKYRVVFFPRCSTYGNTPMQQRSLN